MTDIRTLSWRLLDSGGACEACGAEWKGVHVCDIYSRKRMLDDLRAEVVRLKQRIAELEKKQ